MSMELFAEDIAAFMQAIGIERAHVSGLLGQQLCNDTDL